MKTTIYLTLLSIFLSNLLFSNDLDKIESANAQNRSSVYSNLKVEMDSLISKTIYNDSVMIALSQKAVDLGYVDLSISTWKKILNKKLDILNSSYHLADIYNSLGESDRAIYYSNLGLKSVSTQLDSFKFNNQLSTYYSSGGNYDKSIDLLNQNLKIAKRGNDTQNEANSLLKLGVVYSINGDYDLSLEQFEEAKQLFESIKDLQGVSSSLNNIASIYSSKKEYRKALKYFNKSLELEYQLDNSLGIGRSLNNLGVTYKNLKEYDTAIDYLLESARIKEELGDSIGLVKTLIRIGDIYSSFEDFENALNIFEDAFLISEDLDNKLITMDLNYQLYKLYSRAGEFENGLNYYKTYTDLKDSIFSQEQSKNISNLKVVYETEKKEQKIELLNRENKIIELDNKKQIILRNSSILGLALALVISFLIFRVYKNKKKAHRELTVAHNKLIDANNIIKEKNENIMSSIRYAQRIQNAILPLLDKMQEDMFETSILFMPKDIVSGDFYWHSKVDGYYFIAAVDCTGHGVPGAFMSMIGNTLLNKIVNEKKVYNTAEILEQLNSEVKDALKQESKESQTRDGMDVSLCRIDLESGQVIYTGARRPLYVIDNGELVEIKGDRKSIGGVEKRKKSFSEIDVKVKQSSLLVLTSDGFSGQQNSFGKKFGSKNLKEIILEHRDLNVTDFNRVLLDKLLAHKGDYEQNDDITVVTIKFGVRESRYL